MELRKPPNLPLPPIPPPVSSCVLLEWIESAHEYDDAETLVAETLVDWVDSVLEADFYWISGRISPIPEEEYEELEKIRKKKKKKHNNKKESQQTDKDPDHLESSVETITPESDNRHQRYSKDTCKTLSTDLSVFSRYSGASTATSAPSPSRLFTEWSPKPAQDPQCLLQSTPSIRRRRSFSPYPSLRTQYAAEEQGSHKRETSTTVGPQTPPKDGIPYYAQCQFGPPLRPPRPPKEHQHTVEPLEYWKDLEFWTIWSTLTRFGHFD